MFRFCSSLGGAKKAASQKKSFVGKSLSVHYIMTKGYWEIMFHNYHNTFILPKNLMFFTGGALGRMIINGKKLAPLETNTNGEMEI